MKRQIRHILAIAAFGGALFAGTSLIPDSNLSLVGEAVAQSKKKDAKDEKEPVKFSSAFVKQAKPIEKALTDGKYDEALAGLATLETLPNMTEEEKRYVWLQRLTALQKKGGDKGPFIQAVQGYVDSGVMLPDQAGMMYQQLAAHYNGQKDTAKTLEYYQKYVEVTPEASTTEFDTLARLNMQLKNYAEGEKWLTKAVDAAVAKGEKPQENWMQLRDRCYVELQQKDKRLANLEELAKRYPKKDYYSRVLGLYSQATQDDKVVMMNSFRLAMRDVGLSSVGEYLAYAETAMALGSPGEAVRALERGMADGVVPKGGSNGQSLQEAKDRVAEDRKSLPVDEKTVAKNPKGEVDVKLGLGWYSLGDHAKAVESIRRGLGKGGVKRVDDAQLMLGAALLELGRHDEAKAAFEAAATAAGPGTYPARVAGLWQAYVARQGVAAAPAAAPAPQG